MPREGGMREGCGLAFDDARKAEYCAELAKHGEKTLARTAVMVSWGTVRDHRIKDPEFREAELEALRKYRASIGREIHRRGVEGVDEPVFQGGEEVGQIRRYSDRLLLAHAQRHIAAYRDRSEAKVTVEGSLDERVRAKLGKLNDKQRELLRQLLEAADEPQQEDPAT